MLRVSDNGRFLVEDDGTPFFWMGDTAWGLFHRLTAEEADLYLLNRAAKGFNVVQACLIAPGRLNGLGPNACGHAPLADNDPARPSPAHFDHADAIIQRAASHGIHVALVPVWGAVYVAGYQDGPRVFDDAKAREYGAFVGARYRDRENIVWVLGGDVPVVVEDRDYISLWRAMVEGIKSEDRSGHLMTYHPRGGQTSATWLHDEEWLDFNMLQSGHSHRTRNDERIAADYALAPPKPCVDGEPRYEDHPDRGDAYHGYIDDFDVRKAAYWAVFAGAFGHTYGCHAVWQYWQPGREAVTGARTPWTEALELPGADDMRHLRALLGSRSILTRVPDPSLVVLGEGKAAEHVWATRGDDYAFLYVIPTLSPITIRLGVITGDRVTAWWYDPRDGTHIPAGTIPNTGIRAFTPPPTPADAGRGCDWVLVLDDAAQGYPPPGIPAHRHVAG